MDFGDFKELGSNLHDCFRVVSQPDRPLAFLHCSRGGIDGVGIDLSTCGQRASGGQGKGTQGLKAAQSKMALWARASPMMRKLASLALARKSKYSVDQNDLWGIGVPRSSFLFAKSAIVPLSHVLPSLCHFSQIVLFVWVSTPSVGCTMSRGLVSAADWPNTRVEVALSGFFPDGVCRQSFMAWSSSSREWIYSLTLCIFGDFLTRPHMLRKAICGCVLVMASEMYVGNYPSGDNRSS
ncbi:hypothetical protein ACLOJK_028749 [Asimina triloba]